MILKKKPRTWPNRKPGKDTASPFQPGELTLKPYTGELQARLRTQCNTRREIEKEGNFKLTYAV